MSSTKFWREMEIHIWDLDYYFISFTIHKFIQHKLLLFIFRWYFIIFYLILFYVIFFTSFQFENISYRSNAVANKSHWFHHQARQLIVIANCEYFPMWYSIKSSRYPIAIYYFIFIKATATVSPSSISFIII
jgi:hypothetical protein